MIPWLSPSGRAVLLVAAMVALTGVWLETAGLVVVAELILAAMAWLYLRALSLADEVERGRIRVHIELSEGTRSEARVGDSVALDVVVENLSGDEVDTSNIIEGGRRTRRGRPTSFAQTVYTANDSDDDSDDD